MRDDNPPAGTQGKFRPPMSDSTANAPIDSERLEDSLSAHQTKGSGIGIPQRKRSTTRVASWSSWNVRRPAHRIFFFHHIFPSTNWSARSSSVRSVRRWMPTARRPWRWTHGSTLVVTTGGGSGSAALWSETEGKRDEDRWFDDRYQPAQAAEAQIDEERHLLREPDRPRPAANLFQGSQLPDPVIVNRRHGGMARPPIEPRI